jgi:hypothetical protein
MYKPSLPARAIKAKMKKAEFLARRKGKNSKFSINRDFLLMHQTAPEPGESC